MKTIVCQSDPLDINAMAPKLSVKGAFCELMFLDPKMNIYVQGSEVKSRGLLSSIGGTTKSFNIDDMLSDQEIEFSEKHTRLPYDITVHVSGSNFHETSRLCRYAPPCFCPQPARSTCSELFAWPL